MLGMGRDIDLGSIVLRPARRAIDGPDGATHVEPLVMRLLCILAGSAGRMVQRRALFEACWPGLPIGDDSLNRLVAGARKALRIVGGDRVTIETVPSAGYVLMLAPPACNAQDRKRLTDSAWAAGYHSWRTALPKPDWLAIERLKGAVAASPERADCWGMLALMYRHAAEYADAGDQALLLRSCEEAARAALDREPEQPEARVALVSVVPIFGNWAAAYEPLASIHARFPGHAIAAHDLAIIEMSTGRVEAAKRIIDALIAADPLAPSFAYKSTYHHWTTGDLVMMDQRADRAHQLWPDHPAVWTARFWTLAFTGRQAAASRMVADNKVRPPLPERLVLFLRAAIGAAGIDRKARSAVVDQAVAAVSAGPGQAVISLMALGFLSEVDAAFAVAEAFYCHNGSAPVPIHGDPELRVNEMRRRLTQVLFTPACAQMRADPRFDDLCDRIGMSAYWDNTGRAPDHRHSPCQSA